MINTLRSRRVRGLLGASVAMLILGTQDVGRANEGPYPGLPEHGGSGGWVGAPQGGITQAMKARQWGQIPMQAVAVFAGNNALPPYPPDDPQDRWLTQEFTNYIYLVGEPGAEHNYGISPRFSVRTVAFGAIPVEATLQLIQRRENGFPVPIVATAETIRYNVPSGAPPTVLSGPILNTDTIIEDDVTVRVTRLAVDGVNLGLGSACRTTDPGALSLLGKGFWFNKEGVDEGVDTAKPWLTGHYTPAAGGLVAGDVDIPAFSGCVTSGGEDVSRLLTTAVSGPDNPVRLNVGAPGCNYPLPPPAAGLGPPPPGATTPEAAGCLPAYMPPMIPIPSGSS